MVLTVAASASARWDVPDYDLHTRRIKSITWLTDQDTGRKHAETSITKKRYFDVERSLQAVRLDAIRDITIPEGTSLAIRYSNESGNRWYAKLLKTNISEMQWIVGSKDDRTKHAAPIRANYLLWHGKVSGHHNEVRVDVVEDLELVCFLAYSQPYSGIAMKAAKPDYTPLLQLHDRVFRVDHELFAITNPGQATPDINFEPDLFRAEADEVIPEVYEHFRDTLLDALAKRSPNIIHDFSGYAIGDIEVGLDSAQFMQPRRQLRVADVLNSVRRYGYTPYVGCLPKVGVTKSNGTTRIIFPMHLTYEAALRYFWGDSRVDNSHVLKSAVQYPSNSVNWKSYDVRDCDHTLWPYFKRFAHDIGKSDLLVPSVLTTTGTHDLNRFPSGVFGTTQVVTAFTLALAQYLGARGKYYVHGDGILCQQSLSSDLLRENEINTLNGFRLTGCGRPVFINHHKLHLPRAIHPRLKGAHRFAVLYASYLIMGADLRPPGEYNVNVEHRGKPYHQWTAVDVMEFCCDQHYDPPPELLSWTGSGMPRVSNWDSGISVGINTNVTGTLRRCKLW